MEKRKKQFFQRVFSENGKEGKIRVFAHHPQEIYEEIDNIEYERAEKEPFRECVDMVRLAKALGLPEQRKWLVR